MATDGGVAIANVDADSQRGLGERFGVQSFPTIKWLPEGINGAVEDYEGGRTFDAFGEFLQAKGFNVPIPPKPKSWVTEVQSAGEYDEAVFGEENVVRTLPYPVLVCVADTFALSLPLLKDKHSIGPYFAPPVSQEPQLTLPPSLSPFSLPLKKKSVFARVLVWPL